MKKMNKFVKTAGVAILMSSVLVVSACQMPGALSQAPSELFSSEQSSTGLVNPWMDCTRAEAEKALGKEIILPEDATNIRCSVLTEEGLYEINFTLDGLDYVYRLKKSATREDISGLYYDWTKSVDTFVGGVDGNNSRYISDEVTVDKFEWLDAENGITCCLSTQAEDLSGFDITTIVLKLMGKETDAVDYLAIYMPVLEETLEVIQNGMDDEKEYPYLSTGIMEMVHYNDSEQLLTQIGYCIQDVSGDGIPELLIGDDESYEDGVAPTSYIYGLYSYADGTISTTLEGWARNRYRYVNGDQFVNIGSGGAMYSSYGLLHLTEDGTSYIWDDYYFTYDKEDGDIGYYYNTTGEWDPKKAEEVDLTPMGFLVIQENHDFGNLNWTIIESLLH